MQQKSWGLFLISLILMAGGIFVLLNPMTALLASAIAIGCYFVLLGAGYLWVARQCKTHWCLGLGILDVIIGLILLANINVTASTLPLIFGFWCLFVGVIQFVAGLQRDGWSDTFNLITLLSGVLGIVFGTFIFLYPMFGAIAITLLLGAYLILYGVFEMLRFRRDA